MTLFDTAMKALRPQPAFDVQESARVMSIHALMVHAQWNREFHELNRQ